MEELEDHKQQRIADVSSVLYEIWNPIGVREFNGPSDEYEFYAKEIVSRFSTSVTVDEIVQYLSYAAQKRMNIHGCLNKARLAAEKIVILLRTESALGGVVTLTSNL